jgi:predicted patatin/cPLA2 family phospholipase
VSDMSLKSEVSREPMGVQDQQKLPSLIEVLEHRRAAPGRPDGFKIALVIEGGSMRGVVAGGMISALQELGLSQCFDVATGTSAGAIAASYLLAGQAYLGPRIYYEDLTDRRWLNYLRIFRGQPILDFDYLFDHVLGGTKKLDTEAALESHSRLLITATRKSNWTSAILEPKSPDELMPALKASSRIPLAGGGKVTIDDEDYFDGSITVSIPFDVALSLAPTHILVLLTHPNGESIEQRAGVLRAGMIRFLDRTYPGLGKAHSLRQKRYLRELQRIHQTQSRQITLIRPSKDEPVVGLLEQEANILYAGAEAGARAVFKAFGSVPTEQQLAQLLHRPTREI